MADTKPEPRWPADLSVLVCAGLYVLLSDRLVVGPRWLVPGLVVLLLIPLTIRRHRRPDDSRFIRRLAMSITAIVTAANVVSVGLLVHYILYTRHTLDALGLIYSAASIWTTNVIIFGLWFWELDRGGPHLRVGPDARPPDLQFPQMTVDAEGESWHPRYFDYLYTSFANGTSFAPADAMPLTGSMKAVFASEALISFLTIAIIAGEAINNLH
ncbi:MAG TPA: DUF1345 domain-containing protein [Acidimicrobiales bacterium]